MKVRKYSFKCLLHQFSCREIPLYLLEQKIICDVNRALVIPTPIRTISLKKILLALQQMYVLNPGFIIDGCGTLVLQKTNK